jgi:hypothetical protein
MTIKKIAFATALVFLVTLTGRAQDLCQRQVEPVGGFSICIPEGWRVKEQEGQKFKLLFGTPGQYFTPNINFKDSVDPRSINDYATAAIEYLLEHYKDVGADSVKFVKQEPFPTTSGVSGVKASYRAEFKGLLIRSVQYYLNGKGDQKLIMTATALEVDQATLDPIFDRAAKSFRLEK